MCLPKKSLLSTEAQIAATSNQCMVSKSYERIDTLGDAAEFELALKSSSATAFIGMPRFTFPSDSDSSFLSRC